MSTEFINCNMPYRQVYGLVREILVSSRKNNCYWTFRMEDPNRGAMIACLTWSELFGDILRDLPRFVEVIINIEPIAGFEDKTCLTLSFDIISPLHRGQVNEVVERVRKDIRLAVGAA